MIPVDAPVIAFVVVLFFLATPIVSAIIIARGVKRALTEHRRADQERIDGLVKRLLSGRERRPMGFVLHEGDDQRRPRGDGSGGVFVWWVGPGED